MHGEPHSCVRGVVENLRAVRLSEENRRHALRIMPSHQYGESDCHSVSIPGVLVSVLCSGYARAMLGRTPLDGKNAISAPPLWNSSGGGKADDSFAGAIRESVADVRAELGLDGAEAGKSFVATAGGFQ